MEVHFALELEKQLGHLSTQSARGPAEPIQDVLADYVGEVSRDTRNAQFPQ